MIVSSRRRGMDKKSGFITSLVAFVACTMMLWGWRKTIGATWLLIALSIVRHSVAFTFPDRRALFLLLILLGFTALRWPVKKLAKDSLQRATEIAWKVISETRFLPLA
jgi:hypothetical protein